jgi:alanine racemase
MLPSEALIDLDALRSNARLAATLAGGGGRAGATGERQVIAVVKADAYGHGAVAVSRSLVAEGVGRLAVLTVGEGVALRDAGLDVPILVLAGARDDAEAEEAVGRALTTVLHHDESVSRVATAARASGAPAVVHVEVDTGMHRMGVPPGVAPEFLARVAERSELALEGVFTHLARADEPDLVPSLGQIARFREVLARAKVLGVEPPLVHVDNSASLMVGAALADALPEANAVRPGLMLYGARPAAHLEGELRPVMTLRATVLALREVSAGAAVGYGATFEAPAGGTRVATLSVGYADGVARSLGNSGEVWLAGARRPIVGRVSMDSITVDVGRSADVSLGDAAIVFGCEPASGGTGGLPVEDAAAAAGTLSYELLTRVGRRVPRTLVGALSRD